MTHRQHQHQLAAAVLGRRRAASAPRTLGVLMGTVLGTLWAGSAAASGGLLPGGAIGREQIPPLLLTSVMLLMGSAAFSGSETALFSLQRIDRESLPPATKRRVEQLLAHPRRTLASILIGNEFINVTLGTVTAAILMTVVPEAPWLNVLALTPVLVLFGEVLPKLLAFRYNRRAAGLVAPLIRTVSIVAAPVRMMLTLIADGTVRLTGGTTAPHKRAMREEQLRTLVDSGAEAGEVNPIERELVHAVFEFGEVPVSRLMTPRPDMFMLRLGIPWAEFIDEVRRSTFSRVPVWQGKTDDVVGVLLAKDLLRMRLEIEQGQGREPTTRDVRDKLRRARFVPTTKRAEDLLADFRRDKFHMALVVDEHGSVVGLVTLDDLLADLVGEMLDENDQPEEDIEALAPNTWSVNAGMDIEAFGERFGVAVPGGDYTTLGGFLFSLAGDVPEKGAEITWDPLRFTVSGVEGRRITDVTIYANPDAGIDPDTETMENHSDGPITGDTAVSGPRGPR